MKKHYLLFASLTYAYPILRPLQKEIRRRGDIAAWFLEDSCPDQLEEDELRLKTFKEVKEFNPLAVFAPGNHIYDFFPGVKVSVFHGYPINKRRDKVDDHFKIRGWFDIYCTQGESSTTVFRLLENKHKYFKVYETGWSKTDHLIEALNTDNRTNESKPTIFVATTFSKGISSLNTFYPYIEEMAKKDKWNWFITKHPKYNNHDVIRKYEKLSEEYPNVIFLPNASVEDMVKTDVMLCDSSSIIIEYMLLGKPVVTLNNTSPGPHLLNVTDPSRIEDAISQALKHPKELMMSIKSYTSYHEGHRDGLNCFRILNAVDDFINNHYGKIKKKPRNLFRKIKLRWKLLKSKKS